MINETFDRANQLLRAFCLIGAKSGVSRDIVVSIPSNFSEIRPSMKASMYRPSAVLQAAVIFLVSVTSVFGQAAKDPRLAGAYSFDRGGWKYVHLEGTPEQIGYQHGYLLASEIADMLQVFKLEDEHLTKRDWQFYRDASKNMLWPHIDAEYQRELTAIAKGAQAKGV